MGVAGALGFDVAGRADEPLDEESVGLVPVGCEEEVEVLVGLHDGDAAPAAAVGLLRDDRVPVGRHEAVDEGPGGHRARDPGDRGDVDRLGEPSGLDLVAEGVQDLRGGADPDDSGVEDGLGEAGDLGEEPVARVDGVGVAPGRDVEELVGVHVRLGVRRSAERVGFVGFGDELGVAVGVRVHGDGRDPQVAGRSYDAQGDLRAVGDENAADQRVSPSAWGCMPRSDTSPAVTVCTPASVRI